ncbi:MAG: trigger factor [Gammaproteobacteria bacterium]|nr:trigger factor [Gammaproteobacteria bacterium]
MQVSVETLEGLKRRMTVELPIEQVNEIVDNRLRSMAREMRLDGFRPGKVPLQVVRQRFGVHARQEAYGELIQKSYYEALGEQKLHAVGDPAIDIKDEKDAFIYVAEFEVVPELIISDLGGAELERPVAELLDSDVDGMIEKLRQQRVTWNKVERAAQDGDQLMISFVGKIDDEEFEGGSAVKVPLVLGSGSMIDGFEQGLLGASEGDERSVETTFPDDYQAQHLAGKAAVFEITVNEVAEPVLPEVDEEFAKAMGVEDGSVDLFKQEIRTNMQRELDAKIKSKTKEGVMELLLVKHEFDVPQAIIDDEANRLREDTRKQMESQGQSSSTFQLPVEVFKEQAERRVKLGMLTTKIISEQKIEVDDERLREMIEEFAASYESPQEMIDWYYEDAERIDPVRHVVLEDQVVDWVLSQVKVEEKQHSFDELT